MKQKLRFAHLVLQGAKKDNIYRQLRNSKVSGPYITVGTKRMINFCSNDYLGLSVKKNVTSQMQSSSRLVSGNDVSFDTLEKTLARHKSQQRSLVFPTGYMANLGAISAMVGKNDVVLSDELNHASIIEACRLSGARIAIYKHNDVDDLEKKIKANKAKRKFVITEGIFSMDGDFADLKQITEQTEKSGAILILDDAHGDFTVGTDGRGSAHLQGVGKKIDAYISSLSKGLGSFGGYVASEESIVDLCINKARSFIYTSALPSFLVEMSLQRFHQNRSARQKKLASNVARLSSGLKKIGYDIKSTTHIIPIIIGSEKKALEFGKYVYDNGVFAQPIRYPTVAKNSARLRVSVTAWLSDSHIDDALYTFEKAGKKFDIL
ncbi:aminotransferase class I/II-fold pyridoxal phosphate-dependent enzyme [Candidatus Nitrosotenuis cloacae]|uniref:aminotransferase class I/II-fold pyridoxal phosphate-dependent enzyme n=1 Tax=Candidatus Nitrosotenuis cloacae TaxID=1603555 RepID=UPI00227FE7C1|nr:8-amino-7-oxononanoate synthase [Candidatus Nitrosotenuis cloacae]